MSRPIGLSKSRITLFEQCPRRLWLSVYRPELADISLSVNAGFADGHRVGALACSLHLDGIMIDDAGGLGAALDQTAKVLAAGENRPLFEATFARQGVLVRVDLLLPTATGWHVAEVKNTTGVKDYHHGDLATQLWVIRAAGVTVSRASIRHIDRSFVLTREGDYAGLFADTDIGEHLEPLIAGRGAVVDAARTTLTGDEPILAMGAHCTTPFTCSFGKWCGRDAAPAPAWPVSLLPDTAGKKVAAQLAASGIDDLMQAKVHAMTSPKLVRIHAATISGQPYHDADAVAAETAGWAWPRTYLDFETIQFPIPRWLGTRPFEKVPFQFSAHVEQEDGSVVHYAFLSTDGDDPRRACADGLSKLPSTGAVIAWNAPFERGCLLSLARLFPNHAAALNGIAMRLVDLLPIARRHYYHRDMRGSWSIKAVLPTLGLPGYDQLGEVRSGIDAQAGYLEASNPATSKERCEMVRGALLAYCAQDTEAMLLVLNRLTNPIACTVAGTAGVEAA